MTWWRDEYEGGKWYRGQFAKACDRVLRDRFCHFDMGAVSHFNFGSFDVLLGRNVHVYQFAGFRRRAAVDLYSEIKVDRPLVF